MNFQGIGSSSDQSAWHAVPVFIIGTVLYFLTFVLICANYLWKLKSNSVVCKSLATVFFIALPMFLLLRVIWWVLNMRSDLDSAAFFLNRAAFIVFLFVFNSVLFFWADTIHTTVNVVFAKQAIHADLDFSYMTPVVKVCFWVVTIVTALFTLGTAIAGSVQAGGGHPRTSAVYDINILLLSAVFLGYGGAFLFYGTRLFLRLRDNSSLGWWDLWKVELFSISLCICFLLRVAMFTIRLATHKLIDTTVFNVLCYYIPELIPILLCLWAVNTNIVDDDASHSALIPKQKQTTAIGAPHPAETMHTSLADAEEGKTP